MLPSCFNLSLDLSLFGLTIMCSIKEARTSFFSKLILPNHSNPLQASIFIQGFRESSFYKLLAVSQQHL